MESTASATEMARALGDLMQHTADHLVLFGVPLAGKTTLLQTALARHGGSIAGSIALTGYDRLLSWTSSVGGRTRRLDTAGGAVWSFSSWSQLLDEASGMVLVIDPQEGSQVPTAEHLIRLSITPSTPPVRLVQFTKQDLVIRGFSLWKTPAARRPLWDTDCPVHFSRSDQPETLLAGIEALWNADHGEPRREAASE